MSDCPTTSEAPRVRFGLERLGGNAQRVVVEKTSGPTNSYGISLQSDGTILLRGADDTAILYACLDLAERFERGESLPKEFNLTRTP